MPCYRPVTAYQTSTGEVVFAELARHGDTTTIQLPCGQCIGCRLTRARHWAIRCKHEMSLYDKNCFITLTYDPQHLPEHSSLDYRDYRGFMKRLRKHATEFRTQRQLAPEPIRFYMAGEYGTQCRNCERSRRDCRCGGFIPTFGRPHFHACLFNWDWNDKLLLSKSKSGDLYTSNTLTALWANGF